MEEYVIKSQKTQIHKSPMTNRVLDSCNKHEHKSTRKFDGWPQTPVYVTLRWQSQRIVWAPMRGVLKAEAVSFGTAQWRPNGQSRAAEETLQFHLVLLCLTLSHRLQWGAAAGNSPPAPHSPRGLSWAERAGGGFWVDTLPHTNTSVPGQSSLFFILGLVWSQHGDWWHRGEGGRWADYLLFKLISWDLFTGLEHTG